MEGEEGRRPLEPSDNPLLSHMVFVRMEDLMDKLKLLNYERGFCKKLKFKPFSRHYFALPTNPGEQFHIFTNLAVWLLNMCGKQVEQPQEFDDPNATIATIIAEAKQLNVQLNFPPAKLKSGAGEHVCHVLSELAECALEATHFKWKRPVLTEESTEEEVVGEEGVEISLSRLEEELQQEEEEEEESEEEGAVFLDLTGLKQTKQTEGEEAGMRGAMESKVDAQEWRLEVERVLPSLKVHVRQDNRDWRAHYEQMHQHKDGMEATLTETRGYLDKLHQDISKTLEKISSREKYINNQLEQPIQDFRLAQDRLAEVKERYRQSGSQVNDLSRELARASEELDSVKAEMDEKGSNMMNAGPLVRIKQSLTRLKRECTEMEVRMGVVEHTLLEAKFKNKTSIRQQMNES